MSLGGRPQVSPVAAKEGERLRRVPESEWPRGGTSRPAELWLSRRLLVQVFAEEDGAERMSVSRTAVKSDGRWTDRLTWDELQEAKSQIGRADRWAVEVFPPDGQVVNVANMRHLFLVPVAPEFAWRRA